MDKVKYTPEELELRTFRRTAFYQTVAFKKLQDAIIDRGLKLTPAAVYIGEDWKRISQYITKEQRTVVENLAKKYGRKGGKSRLRKISTIPKQLRDVHGHSNS